MFHYRARLRDNFNWNKNVCTHITRTRRRRTRAHNTYIQFDKQNHTRMRVPSKPYRFRLGKHIFNPQTSKLDHRRSPSNLLRVFHEFSLFCSTCLPLHSFCLRTQHAYCVYNTRPHLLRVGALQMSYNFFVFYFLLM